MQDKRLTDGMFSETKQFEMTYYEEKLKSGLEFQDFVAVEFSKIGIPITSFSSKKFQINKGENLQGFEIKNDEKFRQTGNFWIELKERTTEEKPYTPSGIFRTDNTRFFVIGDYKGVFLIQKKILRLLSSKYKQIENNRKTSIGFLLPVKDAEKYFDYIAFE